MIHASFVFTLFSADISHIYLLATRWETNNIMTRVPTPTHQQQWYFLSPFQLAYKKSYLSSLNFLVMQTVEETGNSSHFDYEQAVNAEQRLASNQNKLPLLYTY